MNNFYFFCCYSTMNSSFENFWWSQNKIVAGIDEAGRGALAGPVIAGAVILDPRTKIKGLNDSKKLTPKRRAALYDDICRSALAVGVGVVEAPIIDSINILQGTMEAMRRAVQRLETIPDHVLIDGNASPFRDVSVSHETVIGGDAQSVSIAAASIVAKVTRDNVMVELGKVYPQYGFEKHKGYGTKQHYAALATHGPVNDLHRQSFRLL